MILFYDFLMVSLATESRHLSILNKSLDEGVNELHLTNHSKLKNKQLKL